MTASCLTCRNARKVKTSCAGEAWCIASGIPVAITHVCLSWVGLDANPYLLPVESADGRRGASHHVQVNSGVKCHFGTDVSEIETRFSALENGVKSHFETEIEESGLGFGGGF